MRHLVRIAALLVTLVSPTASSTTCPFHRYLATGRVVAPTGMNAATVKVYVFLEGADSTSAYLPARGEHDFVVPTQDGAYRFISHYSTRNPEATLPWQSCNRCAHYADVVFVGDGLVTKRIRASIRKANQTESGLAEFVVEVPPVTMEILKNAPASE